MKDCQGSRTVYISGPRSTAQQYEGECVLAKLGINTIIFSLPTDHLLTYSNVPNSLKNGIRCRRVCTPKSLNSIEFWRVRFLVFRLVKLSEYILLNSPHNLLAIYLHSFFG